MNVLLLSLAVALPGQTPIATIAVGGDPTGLAFPTEFEEIGAGFGGRGASACFTNQEQVTFTTTFWCSDTAGAPSLVFEIGVTVVDGRTAVSGPVDHVFADNGDLVGIVLTDLAGDTRETIFVRRDGVVSLVAIAGEPAPGGGAYGFDFDPATLHVTSAGVVGFVDSGVLYVADGATVSRRLGVGDAMPGGTIGVLGPKATLLDDGRVIASAESGDYVWPVGDPDPATGSAAVFLVDGAGAIEPLFDTSQASLSWSGIVGSVSLGVVSRTSHAVLSASGYETGVGPINDLVGSEADGSVVDLTASAADPTIGTSDWERGVMVADTGLGDGGFAFHDPVAGAVVFHVGGARQVVAQAGDPLPLGGSIAAIASVAVAPSGAYAILVDVLNPGQPSNGGRGIYAGDVRGALDLVARVGDEIEVHPGELRTVQTLAFAAPLDGDRGTPIGGDSSLVFLALFTDGTRGVFKAGVDPRIDADLRLTLELTDASAKRGSENYLQVTVENAGAVDAHDVRVHVAFAPGDADPAPDYPSACDPVLDDDLGNLIAVDCAIDELLGGATVEIGVPFVPLSGGEMIVTGEVTMDQPEANPADNAAEVTFNVDDACDLAVEVDVDGENQIVIEVKNLTETVDAHEVTIEIETKGDARFLSLRSGDADCGKLDGQGATCTLPILVGGDSIRMVLGGAPRGESSATVTVSSVTPDANLDNNRDDASLTGSGSAGCSACRHESRAPLGGLALIAFGVVMVRRQRL
jgi:hypothetical protein